MRPASNIEQSAERAEIDISPKEPCVPMISVTAARFALGVVTSLAVLE